MHQSREDIYLHCEWSDMWQKKEIVFNGLFRNTVSHNVTGNNFTSKILQTV